MREILFRGKRVDEYGWVYGWLIYDEAERNQPRIVIGREYSTGTFFNAQAPRVMRDTVGQFTGLTDKNGKKIFEGDIVKFNNQVGKIVNECGSLGIGFDECINYKRLEVYIEDNNNFYNGCYNDNFISLWEICWNCNTIDERIKEVEVIGNIHDNPELLQERTDTFDTNGSDTSSSDTESSIPE